ncbi:MAG: RNA methyltransferase [Bacteroidetes bacterium]|nr:RNA methyltransferase [Bacteroidota bacterium]
MLTKSKLKYIQSLGHKKPRDEAGVFIAEGPKLLNELLETAPETVLEVFALKEWIDEHKKILTKNTVEVITEKELERISGLATPNNVVAIVKKMNTTGPVSAKGKVTLVLDTIQDPGNLGTIIRTADWFGVTQIVCSANCADLYNSKVVQATMGSIIRVKVFYEDIHKWLSQQQEVPIYAAMLEGEDMTSLKKVKEGIILIGNESRGISDELINLATVKVTISGKGSAESLNAAVATGILLSQLV